MTENIGLFQHESNNTSGKAVLAIDADTRSLHTVNPWLYGKFCEHLGANIYHGMEAQILFNCIFGKWRFSVDNHPDGGVCEASDRESIERRIQARAARMDWPDADPVIDAYFDGGAYGWFRVGTKEYVQLSPDVAPSYTEFEISNRAQRVEVLGDSGGIGQWTYLPLHRTHGFEFRIVGRAVEPTVVRLSLAPVNGDRNVTCATIQLGRDWKTFTGHLELPADAQPDALYQFTITADAPTHFIFERVLLYPEDHIGGADPDVIRLLKESHLPLLRWPGGNFCSGYRWRLGVGEIDTRPTVPNPAWEGLEFNLFGTDEFIAFCRTVSCEPLICVNAGDGTPAEAAAWVEYCNGSPETPMGRLRTENGHPEPYNVKYWEIGNEIYGRWQVTWTTPEGNVDRYRRFREAMLSADSSIKLLGCGLGGSPNSEWNDQLIDAAGDTLRCITDHILTGGSVDADTEPVELYHAFMGYAAELEQRYATLRERMQAAGIDNPRLAITELQLFARFRGDVRPDGKLSPQILPRPDTIAEALYHATIVNTCIRLGNFVEMLTHSATVNHGGGLRKERERVYPNPIHYGHTMGAELAGGTPVAIRVNCETFSTEHNFGHIPLLENIPVLDAMAVISPNDDLVLMLVHRGATCGVIELTVNLEGFLAQNEAMVVTLKGESWHDRNTMENPDNITPCYSRADVLNGNILKLTVLPFSLTCVTLKKS